MPMNRPTYAKGLLREGALIEISAVAVLPG
jgi:hypothetical protein